MPLIGTLDYNWPMSAHVSQAFSTWNVPIWKIYYELGVTHGDCDIPDIAPTIRARCFLLVGSSRTWSGWSFRLQPVKRTARSGLASEKRTICSTLKQVAVTHVIFNSVINTL